MRRALVAELQRLKRRARARWPLVVLITAALTAAVLYKQSQKVRVHEAEVTLAVTEGSLSDGFHPIPVGELRDYVTDVLLSDSALMPLIIEWELFPLREKMGDSFAINELRDLFAVFVNRNYFLEQYDVDQPRSARITIEVTHPDPDFAWRLARRLATMVIDGEQQRRLELADALAADVTTALAAANARLSELESAVADRGVALATAEADDDSGAAAGFHVEMADLSAQLFRESKAVAALSILASRDQQSAALDRAGLGMQFVITGEHRPVEEPGARLYFRVIIGAMLFVAFLPIVSIFIGTFDTRVHDREDVERIGLPVLGHLPPFPGDRVGSLRARGVRGRRVPS